MCVPFGRFHFPLNFLYVFSFIYTTQELRKPDRACCEQKRYRGNVLTMLSNPDL
jgi:hypothetical protein